MMKINREEKINKNNKMEQEKYLRVYHEQGAIDLEKREDGLNHPIIVMSSRAIIKLLEPELSTRVNQKEDK